MRTILNNSEKDYKMKIDKTNYYYLGLDFSQYSTAQTVASLMGFRDVHNIAARGFRLNWKDLSDKGAFDNCNKVGDFLNVYLNSLTFNASEGV